MKEIFSKFLFILFDLLVIALSIVLAYELRGVSGLFDTVHTLPLSNYLAFYPIYITTIAVLAYEGVYSYRYDFWHETRLVIKAIFFSLIIVLAYLALNKSVENYSRTVIVLSFGFMAFLIPTFKRIVKLSLYHLGIWKKEAKIFGNDPFLSREVFENPYLGYIDASPKEPKTVFVSSRGMSQPSLKKTIDSELRRRHEVLFIPLLNDFDLTHSHIYELSNTRTNLVSLQNRLKSKARRIFKYLFDFVMAILLLPILLPILGIIAYRIKKEEPDGSILFKQKRLGKEGKAFVCYKFRTMAENSEKILKEYLKKHPEEAAYYDKYHKYLKDPRVTKIGSFLRKTSLDELPQVFNVLKGEMSFVGPRPYMLNEKEKMGESVDTILNVRPGITGLWQVNGRSEIDFFDRIDMDIWYIRNWNLWMDIVILLKTVKTVLVREGAY